MSSDSGSDDSVADTDKTDVGRVMATESSDLGSLLGHFYRAEMDRTTTWRQRFDETTKWAVTIIAAVLAYGFSTNGTHIVLLAGIVITTSFLVIEARRYQTYDIWRSRVRLLQENLFADALDPQEGIEHTEWRRQLGDDLRTQTVKTSYVEAFDRRLRRVYLPLLLLLLFAWVFRILAFDSGSAWRETAAIGRVPGVAVVATVALFYLAIVGVAAWPRQRRSMGEKRREKPGQWKRDRESE